MPRRRVLNPEAERGDSYVDLSREREGRGADARVETLKKAAEATPKQ